MHVVVCLVPCAFCVDQGQRLVGMGSWEAQSLPLSSYPEVGSVTDTASMNTTVIIDAANLASQIAEVLERSHFFFNWRAMCHRLP